jgi:hypothetical protein
MMKNQLATSKSQTSAGATFGTSDGSGPPGLEQPALDQLCRAPGAAARGGAGSAPAVGQVIGIGVARARPMAAPALPRCAIANF